MSARACPRLVSVVIPFLNDAETLADQLAALRAQDYTGDWELLAVDNGSTDGSVEIAERWVKQFPHARVVRADEHRSPGHARNAGASHAIGDFLAFSDADDALPSRATWSGGALWSMASTTSAHERGTWSLRASDLCVTLGSSSMQAVRTPACGRRSSSAWVDSRKT